MLRWIALVVFVAILGTVFVNLGEWQLRRLHQRRASNAATISAEKAPVVPFTEFFGHRAIVPSDEWHHVSVTGTFDPAHQFVIRYRDNGGGRGYEVVTPLHAANGMTVLVDRGFITLQGNHQIPSTAPPPPTGTVSITGHVRRDETGRTSATRPVNGHTRLIDAVEIGKVLPYPIADGYISALTMQPAQTGGFEPVQVPELSDGPHFWYAVQWFLFTGIGAMGVVFFIRSDILERRQAQEAKRAQDEPGATAGGPPNRTDPPDGTDAPDRPDMAG